MADDKKTSKTATVYNTAEGPRSIFAVDGVNHIIAPGGSVKAEFSRAELNDLMPDLTTTKPKADADDDDAEPGADAAAEALARDAEVLAKANSPEELKKLAETEKVAIDKDDGHEMVALKIAQARAGVQA